MNTFKRWEISTAGVLTVLLCWSASFAQTLGNPAVLEKNMWSIGILADIAEYNLDGLEYRSYRGLTKIDFSVAPFFDTAVILGIANLHITYPPSQLRERFRAKNSFAVGAALKFVGGVPLIPRLKVFGEFGGIKFSPVADVVSTSPVDSEDPQVFNLRFDWREFWSTAGTILSLHPYDFYVGIQERVFQQIERNQLDEYVSEWQPNFIAGMDIHLPQDFTLNLQVRTANGLSIALGFSQAGFLRKITE